MERVIFLDRDGTLNEEVNYLHRKEDLKLLTGVPQALRMFREHGYRIVVITNQAGVARGYYKEEDVHALHAYMNELLEKDGAAVDAFFYCPHHPEHGIGEYKKACHCRKPETGMFEQAEKLFSVDKEHSWMIGDKLIDVQAGRNYGVRTVLVGTGYGETEREKALAEVGAGEVEREKAPSETGTDASEREKAHSCLCTEDERRDASGMSGDGERKLPYDLYAETLVDAARAILGEGNSDRERKQRDEVK